jgi:hypothetical protein
MLYIGALFITKKYIYVDHKYFKSLLHTVVNWSNNYGNAWFFMPPAATADAQTLFSWFSSRLIIIFTKVPIKKG